MRLNNKPEFDRSKPASRAWLNSRRSKPRKLGPALIFHPRERAALMHSETWYEQAGKLGVTSGPREIPDAPKVLVAAIDWQVRVGLSTVLPCFTINTVWVASVAEASRVLESKDISACLCAFWLEDGTFKDLARYMRRLETKVPVIAVSAPACRNEYRDYLAAMNIGAFDFLCHPYLKSDLDRVLRQAIMAHTRQSWHPSRPNLRA
jgi:CheY-like chemotaxis protein